MRSVYFLMVGLIISSCQNFSENEFMTEAGLVKCPANGCANTKSDANSMTIFYSGPKPIYSKVAETAVSIGGDCFASTYPDNRIDVTVYQTGFANPLALGGYVVPLNSGSTVKCVKGRYNFTIGTGLIPSVGSYKVKLQLVGIDQANQLFPGAGALIEIPISRY